MKYPRLTEYMSYRGTILEVGAFEAKDDTVNERIAYSRKCHELASKLKADYPLHLLAKEMIECLDVYNRYYPGDKNLPQLLAELKKSAIDVMPTHFMIHIPSINFKEKHFSLEDAKKRILEVFKKTSTTGAYVTEFDPNTEQPVQVFDVEVTDIKFNKQ